LFAITVYTANVLFGTPESVFRVRKARGWRIEALTITKIYKVYGETYWEFWDIWNRLPGDMREHREELHARHAWVVMMDR